MKAASLLFLLLISLVFVQNGIAQIRLEFKKPGEIEMRGFRIDTEEEVNIKGRGARLSFIRDSRGGRWFNNLNVYGWIIESSSRKPVWNLSDKMERNFGEGTFSFEDKIKLKPGEYELYLTGAGENESNFAGWLNELFNPAKNKEADGDLFIEVSGKGVSSASIEGIIDRVRGKAVISFIRAGDGAEYKKEFTLTADIKFKIYALGEAVDDEAFDYAFIYDLVNNKRVWEMNFANSDKAGGAAKNIVFNDVIELKKGSYVLRYMTDDSHSSDRWNAKPPVDPNFYGITMNAVEDKDISKFKELDKGAINLPIVEFINVKEGERLSKELDVKGDVKIKIVCYGEGDEDELYDYGWIKDNRTDKTIWSMRRGALEHAGGAGKNVKVEDTIELKEGKYTVFYSTDDSHSYNNWNAAPPVEWDRYGITIWTVKKEDRTKISGIKP